LNQAFYAIQQAFNTYGANYTIAIIDATGYLKVLFRPDLTFPISSDQAIAKAKFVFEAAQAQQSPILRPVGALGSIDYSHGWFNTAPYGSKPYVNQLGGRGIYFKNTLVGSVGVSGIFTAVNPSVDDTIAAAVVSTLVTALGGSSSASSLTLPLPNPQESGIFSQYRANQIIQTCIQTATTNSVNANIAVMDLYRQLKFFVRMDNAPLGGVDLAIQKARSGVLFGGSSYYSTLQSGGVSENQCCYGTQFLDENLAFLSGTAPFNDGSAAAAPITAPIAPRVVGAIGVVSGGSLSTDDTIANSAVNIAVDPINVCPRNPGLPK